MSKPIIENKKHIELIGERNGMLPAVIEKMSKIAIWNAGVSMALILALSAGYIFQPSPQSFAIDPSGKVTKLIPLSEGVGTEGVVDFVGRTVISSFSIDFLHWETQIGTLAPSFTPGGYISYQKSIELLKDRVVEGRFITAVGMSSPPIVVKSMLIDGVMKYRVRMEILISFEGQTKRIAPQRWQVDVIAERVPTNKSLVGIAVSSMIAKQTGNTSNAN